MTRKLLFGMLMVLVLAFSVQGTADAITSLTSRSGDLVTVSPNQSFTIQFSVGIQSQTLANSNYRRIPSNHASLTGADPGTYYYNSAEYTTAATLPDPNPNNLQILTTGNRVTEADAYHFNEEAVSVAATGAGTSVMIDKIGSYDITNVPTHPLTESYTPQDSDDTLLSSTGGDQLSRSMSVTLFATGAGTVGITVTDTTDNADRDGATVAPAITFTVYVVENSWDVDADELAFATGILRDENYQIAGDNQDPAVTANPDGGSTNTNVETTYSVQGPGRVYVEVGTRKGSAASRLVTSSTATVRLDMNGGTNVVTASIPSVAPEMAVFIYGNPSVEIIQGNGQEGAAQGRLENSIGVKVTDERGRAVPGVAVTFDTAAPGAMFIPVSGTTVYTAAVDGNTLTASYTAFTVTATSSNPSPGTDIIVQTDSRGEAKTYFQLGTGTNGTTQTVTAMAAGAAATATV